MSKAVEHRQNKSAHAPPFWETNPELGVQSPVHYTVMIATSLVRVNVRVASETEKRPFTPGTTGKPGASLCGDFIAIVVRSWQERRGIAGTRLGANAKSSKNLGSFLVILASLADNSFPEADK